jgi:hypothetical protein
MLVSSYLFVKKAMLVFGKKGSNKAVSWQTQRHIPVYFAGSVKKVTSNEGGGGSI